MATVTKLAGNIKAVKDAGFIKASQYDFDDDGSKFTGYSFEGVPLTQSTYKNQVFLSVRFDYLVPGIPFNFYSKYSNDIALNKYNGTENKIDLDDLIQICKQTKVAAEKAKTDFEKLSFDKDRIINNLEAGIKLKKGALRIVQDVCPFELNLNSNGLNELHRRYQGVKKDIEEDIALIQNIRDGNVKKYKLYLLNESNKVEEGYNSEQVKKIISGKGFEFYYNR